MQLVRALIVMMSLLAAAVVIPVQADDQVTYVSQPEALAIFLNGVASARDVITIAGSAKVEIVLPEQAFQDTLILRENDERVSNYRVSTRGARLVIHLPASTESRANLRELTLEYLLSGLGWRPTYDMWIASGEADPIMLDFFAEIQPGALQFDDVDVALVAGRVDVARQLSAVTTITANQYLAGYDEATGAALATGPVVIQQVYSAGRINAEPGDTIYISLLQGELPARRVILWNAQTDPQAAIIYKVRNDSEFLLAEGIVRSYQDKLFVGSDFLEVTPVGGEGSITVGGLQNLRVNRAESRSHITNAPERRDTLHRVTLTLSSFSERPTEVEVIDRWPPTATNFVFSEAPQQEAGNVFRWVVTILPGETLTIDYEFTAES